MTLRVLSVISKWISRVSSGWVRDNDYKGNNPPGTLNPVITSRHAAGKAEAGLRLYRAAMAGDLVAMAAALAEGSEVNGSIGEDGGGRTPLIGAAIGVSRKYILIYKSCIQYPTNV